jgi:hypothetical protein
MTLSRTAATADQTAARPLVVERRGTEASPTFATATAAGALLVFFISLLVPIHFSIGSLRLSPYRIFLLMTFIPLLLRLFSGAAGRVTATDILLMLYCLWMTLALMVVHGTERITFAGITSIELFGGYLIGRLWVRNAVDHKLFFRYFFIALIFLLPFACIELLSGRKIILELFRPLFQTIPFNGQTRYGLQRVQSVFDHPILFGLFCALGIGNIFYIYRQEIAASFSRAGLAVGMAAMSLSAGPLLAIALQTGMVMWDKIMKGRWVLLTVLAGLTYITLDLLSNRTPIVIIIETLTFSTGTGWTRIHIWNYGSAEVVRNPIFGIGLNDWQRPSWLTWSVDNFWLLTAMRYGLPAALLLISGLLINFWRIVRTRDLDETAKLYRIGYIITSVGIFMTLSTVHIWNAMSVLVMFYIGMGAWFYTASVAEPAADAIPNRAFRTSRISSSGLERSATDRESPRDQTAQHFGARRSIPHLRLRKSGIHPFGRGRR